MRTWLERYHIHQKAKRMVHLLKDEEDFMEQCVQDVMDNGGASDEDEAEAICEILWDEIGDN